MYKFPARNKSACNKSIKNTKPEYRINHLNPQDKIIPELLKQVDIISHKQFVIKSVIDKFAAVITHVSFTNMSVC